MIVITILSLLSLAWAWRLFRRLSGKETFEQWTIAAFPPLGLLLLLEIVAGVLRSPTLLWNEVRMCRSVALLRGFSLYPPRDALGPVIGTLHAPVSHCFYLLAAGFKTPTSLILAGSALSVLVVFVAVAWISIRARATPERWSGTIVAFLFCGFLILQTPGTYNAVFMIHTDAPALAFATVACGILCGRKGRPRAAHIWIAGITCALVIGCKQTLAPVSVGLMFFLALVGGWRDMIRFLSALLTTGAVMLAAIAASIPMRVFLFNTVTMAANRPLKAGYIEILSESFRSGKLEALPALFPIAALLLHGLLFEDRRLKIRQIVEENRWLVFIFVGISLVPVCAKAIVTVGADVNHLGLVLYFLFVGSALAIQQNVDASLDFPRFSARLFAVLGILVSLAPGAAFGIPSSVKNVATNASEAAYQYAAHHGTSTYFPLNPAAALLTYGKLYHVDVALFDREIGGAPLTPKQVLSGLPSAIDRIALPPGERIASVALNRLVSGWVMTSDPELPAWTVLKRKP